MTLCLRNSALKLLLDLSLFCVGLAGLSQHAAAALARSFSWQVYSLPAVTNLSITCPGAPQGILHDTDTIWYNSSMKLYDVCVCTSALRKILNAFSYTCLYQLVRVILKYKFTLVHICWHIFTHSNSTCTYIMNATKLPLAGPICWPSGWSLGAVGTNSAEKHLWARSKTEWFAKSLVFLGRLNGLCWEINLAWKRAKIPQSGEQSQDLQLPLRFW